MLATWTPHRALEVKSGGALLALAREARDRVPGSIAVRPYGLLQVQLKVD